MKTEFITLALILIVVLAAGCTGTNPNPAPDTNSNNPTNGGTNMPTVQNGDTISVNYRGTLADGTEFDSSLKEGRTPLEFVVGAGQMIKGFDQAVVGMKQNQEKTITLAPADAYGEKNTTPQEIPKEQFGALFETLTVGQILQTANGLEAEVLSKTANSATVLINHPLAGKALTFWIKIETIQKPA